MAEKLHVHQHSLHLAVEALGTRPHPLRFFRADKPVEVWEPPQAALALAALPVARTHPGWRSLWTYNNDINAEAISARVSEGCADFALRPMVVRGQRNSQALLFCDGSVLFGRHIPNDHGGLALHFWPAVAQLRTDATKVGKERFARAEAIAGYGITEVRLRLWEKRDYTLLTTGQTWIQAARTRTTHPGFAALQDTIDRVVAALPEEPVGALDCIGPVGTPIDAQQADWFHRPHWAGMANTNPPWMPHRWIKTTTLEQRQEAAKAALIWIAIGAQASKATFHYADKWTAATRPWTSWRVKTHRQGIVETYPFDRLVASGTLPPSVQDALMGVAIASEGIVYTRESKERMVQARPPNVAELVGTPPVSAHERMQAVALWGPTIAWTGTC